MTDPQQPPEPRTNAEAADAGSAFQSARDQYIRIVRLPWQWAAGVALAVAALAAALVALIPHLHAPRGSAGPGSGALSTPTVAAQATASAGYGDGCVPGQDGNTLCFVWDLKGARAYATPSQQKQIGVLQYGVQPFSCQSRGETATKVDVTNRRYYNYWWLRYDGPPGNAWVNAVDILGGWDYGRVPNLKVC